MGIPKEWFGKRLRITDRDGLVFDGFCSFNSYEFNEHVIPPPTFLIILSIRLGVNSYP